MNVKIEVNKQGVDLADRAGRYLIFQLDQGSFGIPVVKAREIIKIQEITPIPNSPEFAKGVINLREKVIPIVDLRIKFGLGKSQTSDRTCIIVVSLVHDDGRETSTGLIVDAVEEVLYVESGWIEAVPNIGESGSSIDCLIGVTKVKKKVILLLDVETIV